jgi:hypothetical protein
MIEKNFSNNPRLKKLLDFKPLTGQMSTEWSNQLELFSNSPAKYKRVMACRHKTGKIKLEFVKGQFTQEQKNSLGLQP